MTILKLAARHFEQFKIDVAEKVGVRGMAAGGVREHLQAMLACV